MADTLTIPVTLPCEFVALLGAPSQASKTARELLFWGCFRKQVSRATRRPNCSVSTARAPSRGWLAKASPTFACNPRNEMRRWSGS